MAKMKRYLIAFELFVMLIHRNKMIYTLIIWYTMMMFLLFKMARISFIMPVFSISYVYNYSMFYSDVKPSIKLLKKVYNVNNELFSILKILFIYLLNIILISCLIFVKESTLLIIVSFTSYTASFLFFSIIYFLQYVLKDSK
jgi:hypothetical protein